MVCLETVPLVSKHSPVEKMPRIQMFQNSLGKAEGRSGGRRAKRKGKWGRGTETGKLNYDFLTPFYLIALTSTPGVPRPYVQDWYLLSDQYRH